MHKVKTISIGPFTPQFAVVPNKHNQGADPAKWRYDVIDNGPCDFVFERVTLATATTVAQALNRAALIVANEHARQKY